MSKTILVTGAAGFIGSIRFRPWCHEGIVLLGWII